MIKSQNLIKIQKVMIIIFQILLQKLMMIMIIVHQQIASSGGIDKKMSVNGYVMNVTMLIKVQMQFVRVVDKANNLEVKLEM
jgi:DNA/RNA endonuclease YhcR with UshA esterase domain